MIPKHDLLSEGAVNAIRQVLTANRSIVEAYQSKGVDWLDVTVLCQYAIYWIRANKLMVIELPEEAG